MIVERRHILFNRNPSRLVALVSRRVGNVFIHGFTRY